MNTHALEAQYPFKRKTQVQLRFNDIDALGHVNNSVYFQFFDLAKTEYFAGLEVDADINWCKPAIVIVVQTRHRHRQRELQFPRATGISGTCRGADPMRPSGQQEPDTAAAPRQPRHPRA